MAQQLDRSQDTPPTAAVDVGDPALWPHVAKGINERDQACLLEEAPGDPGGRQVGALIADVRALIRQCDSLQQRRWGA